VIPVSNPRANYLAHKDEIDEAIARAVSSGRYIVGEETEAFEEEYAEFIGTQHCVAMSSGTSALEMLLRALEIGPGDEVVTVSHTATGTVAPIVMVGAKPVWADTSGGLMSPQSAEKCITPRTKAILPVHLYGEACNMTRLKEIADFHGLYLIEDACQAHGARHNGRRVGSWGIAGFFSHYPTKNLACLGDGGSITTDNKMLASKLREMRFYGWDKHKSTDIVCGQSRLSEIQAAVLRVKLKYLDEENARRRIIAKRYSSAFPKALVGDREQVMWPLHGQVDETNVFHQYVLESTRRPRMMKLLKEAGIGVSIHYPHWVRQQSAYGNYGHSRGVSSSTVMSIPMYPELTNRQISSVIDEVNKAASAAWYS